MLIKLELERFTTAVATLISRNHCVSLLLSWSHRRYPAGETSRDRGPCLRSIHVLLL